jgi:hypothetical protein
MTPNPACEYCGAPLAPNASACEACGQPVPSESQMPMEVPQSYITTSQPEAPPPAPSAETSIREPVGEFSTTSQPQLAPQVPSQRRNNCLRFGLIIVLILVVVCCCLLSGLVVVAGNIDVDSLPWLGLDLLKTVNIT